MGLCYCPGKHVGSTLPGATWRPGARLRSSAAAAVHILPAHDGRHCSFLGGARGGIPPGGAPEPPGGSRDAQGGVHLQHSCGGSPEGSLWGYQGGSPRGPPGIPQGISFSSTKKLRIVTAPRRSSPPLRWHYRVKKEKIFICRYWTV